MENRILVSIKDFLKHMLPEGFYLVIRKIIFHVLNFLLFLCASCYMWFLNLKQTTKITFINSERIGHFVLHVDLFFRVKKMENIKEKNILLIALPVCNEFLLQKWGELGSVVDYRKTPFFAYMLKTLFLYNSQYIREMPMKNDEYPIYQETDGILTLTDGEKQKGSDILQDYGMSQDDWFVCIFARDDAYASTIHDGKSISPGTIRNTSIDSLIPSIEFIIQRGGWVVRLGKVVEKRASFNHPRFIDYPFESWRSDFMDFYLQYRAKFVISSSTSGATDISSLFNTPYCGVNMPFYFNPAYRNALHQPVCIIDRQSQPISLLEWSKIVQNDEGENDQFCFKKPIFLETDFYERNNLTCIENTPEEILGLVKEMFERLDGSFEQDKKDKELQAKYLEIYKNYTFFANNKNPIGRAFLRRNAGWFLKEGE